MKNIKYISLLFGLIAFIGCNEPEDVLKDTNIEPEEVVELPQLITGSADFSKFVSLGNSLTAGFSDGALFKAAQENSFPSILAQKFEMLGGGAFTQPLTNDNFGGLALNGNRIPDFNPRLVTIGGAPLALESVKGPVTVTTDILLNNPTGPFNNMGVPGAKSFHLLAPGYGNLSNLPLGLANPYFVRMTGTTPNASVLELSMAQAPTFFSLWIGNNDVLGYALSGGESDTSADNYNPITPVAGPPGVGFDQSYGALIATLTSGGAKGVVANIPDVTSIPHFTTVPYNAVPLDAATATQLNAGFALYNGGIAQAFAFLVANTPLTQEAADLEIAKRTVVYSAGQNPVLILDEDLTNLTAINPQLVSMRPATEDDLLVLASSSFIGTAISATQINGVSVPLADKWVLTPEEQEEIATATAAFNITIENTATQAGLAFVDANALLNELNTTGIASGNFILASNLVTGGMFSLDGFHLTSRGYALTANEFMKEIDVTYGTNFEVSGNLVDIGNYPTNYSPQLQ